MLFEYLKCMWKKEGEKEWDFYFDIFNCYFNCVFCMLDVVYGKVILG